MITKQILILEHSRNHDLYHLLGALNTKDFRLGITIFHHPMAVLRYLRTPRKIDVILLTLHFTDADLSGLDIAAFIRRNPIYNGTRIIFISSLPHYRHWCLQQYNAFDFIVKPYAREVVLASVGRALHHPAYPSYPATTLYLPVAHTHKTISLHCASISCIEKNDRFMIIWNKNGSQKKHTITNGTFLHLRKMLPLHPSIASLHHIPLLEIHCSIIVNVEAVTEVSLLSHQKSSPYLKVKGCDMPLPIARKHYQYIKSLFSDLH